ncbi:MAG: MFS transporter [Paracoccaceae bacterium]
MIDIALLFVAYLLSQFYRSFLPVLTPALTADLGVDAADLSRAAGAWFVAFAAMQAPAGLALDLSGPRRLVAAGLVAGCGGGALLFGAAEGAWWLVAGMALIGAGCAPILISGLFLFARRFPPGRFATLAGLMIGFGSLGNVLGAAPLAAAVEAFGWRSVMAGLAAAAGTLGLVALAVMRDPPRLETTGAGGALAGYAELLRIRALWPVIPLALFSYAVPVGLRGLWSGPWLAEVHTLDTLALGQAILWMAIAMTAGNFAFGPLDRLLGTRKWVLVGANAVVAALIWALALGPAAGGPAAAAVILAAIGFFGGTYAVMSAHFTAFAPARLTGRAVTLLTVFTIGGAGLGQLITGAIHEASGAGPEAYGPVFLWYAGTLTIALGIYLFSRDAKP